MRKLLFCLLALVSQFAVAENAKDVLDKAAARFKAAGNVKIGFQMNANGNSTTGYIDVADSKFFCDMAGVSVWFDGSTMWHYVKANEEVNVTTPSQKEVVRMNPYSFLTLYKKGYACRMGKSTSAYYEVVLTGEKDAAYQSLVVRLKKGSYEPVYVKTVTKKVTTEITVNSYLTNQKFPEGTFRFNPKEFPKVEVVDLR